MREITIRNAVASDCSTILRLIRELARFEGLLDSVKADEQGLRRDGFGAQPHFECLLAEADDGGAPQTLGFALYTRNYSTFEGRAGLYLEDIFVVEEARGRGVGERLMARLASIALARGCARLELSVLDWNPARRFYQRHDFRQQSEWLPYRLSGTGLAELAARDSATPDG